jgi:hypothetical protein
MALMKRAIFMVIILFSFMACSSPNNGEVLPGESKFEQVDGLFVDPGVPGWLMFHADADDAEYRGGGYTLWTLRGAEGILGYRTLRLRKPAGSNIAGYGMVLCYKIRLVEGETVPVMLMVMINNSGQYGIGKVIDGTLSYISPWTVSSALNVGSGQENTMTVQYNSDNEYLLKFNGTSIREFECDGEGRNGYVAVITPTDLNGTDVEVWFKEE